MIFRIYMEFPWVDEYKRRIFFFLREFLVNLESSMKQRLSAIARRYADAADKFAKVMIGRLKKNCF